MDIEKLNTILEDISQVIGYARTALLVDWFGGANLHVPMVIEDSHPIARVIGTPAARRLAQEWGGEVLWLPLDYQRERNRRDRLIGLLLGLGIGAKQIAAVAGISEPMIQKVRIKLESENLLPLVLRQAGVSSESRHKTWSKPVGRKGHKR